MVVGCGTSGLVAAGGWVGRVGGSRVWDWYFSSCW